MTLIHTHSYILVFTEVEEGIEGLILEVGEVMEKASDELGCEAPFLGAALHSTQDLQELRLMLMENDKRGL